MEIKGKIWKNSGGFTLIELLVVISIIGVLSTIALTSLNGAKMKARDAKRLSDMNQIKNALNVYYYSHGTYPEESSSNGDVEWSYEDGGDFLGALVTDGHFQDNTPLDPINSTSYPYGYYKYTNDASCGSMIVLVAQKMETDTYYERSADCNCRSWIALRDWAYCEKY